MCQRHKQPKNQQEHEPSGPQDASRLRKASARLARTRYLSLGNLAKHNAQSRPHERRDTHIAKQRQHEAGHGEGANIGRPLLHQSDRTPESLSCERLP